MKRIAPFVFIAFAAIGLLGTPSTAFALPPCPEDQHYSNWDNCFGSHTYLYAGRAKYVGEYKDGRQNGRGTLTYVNGNKYVGEWWDGKRNGQGTFTFRDGRKYVGEYKDGFRNGQGTYTFADGRKYVGEWRDGQENGQGIQYAANGTVTKEGTWKNSVLVRSHTVVAAAAVAAAAPVRAAPAAVAVAPPVRQSAITPAQVELELWNAVKNSKTSDGFEAYLSQYPAGQFAALALAGVVVVLKAEGEREAQAARDREAQAARDREAQAARDREAQAARDREAQAARGREAQAAQAQAARDREAQAAPMAALEAAQMAALERTNEAKWPEASIGFGTQVAILDFLSWKPEDNLVGQRYDLDGPGDWATFFYHVLSSGHYNPIAGKGGAAKKINEFWPDTGFSFRSSDIELVVVRHEAAFKLAFGANESQEFCGAFFGVRGDVAHYNGVACIAGSATDGKKASFANEVRSWVAGIHRN